MRLLILVMMILATPLLAQPVKKNRNQAARPDTVDVTKISLDTMNIEVVTEPSVPPGRVFRESDIPRRSYSSQTEILTRSEPATARPPVSNYIFQIDPLDDTSYRYWFGRRSGGDGIRDYTQELLDRGFYHAEDIKGYDSTMIRVEDQRIIPLSTGSTPIIIQTGWYSTHRTDTLMLNVARSNQGWIITQAPIPTK